MRVELIKFKRCCCCLPLRYGLLILGYIKLLCSIAILLSVATAVVELVRRKHNDGNNKPFVFTLALIVLAILVILCDAALTLVLVVGSHKKSARLLKVYNYYSIGMLVLFVLSFLLLIAADMYRMVPRMDALYAMMLLRGTIATAIVSIFFQVYIILVIKSEITKLEINCGFQFTNNANEAQCTMNNGGINEINVTGIINNEPVENGANSEN